ncbi:ABC transporter permease [Microbacterium sp. NPDC057659]|uniref:ABC transporter permease n=1 Tax=Microbacterium sp. NPDC057659 TaxID=3346198 RepID=UPI00366BB77E
MTSATLTVATQRAPKPRRRVPGFLRSRRVWFSIIDFVVVITVWHLAVVTFGVVNKVFLPAPMDVLLGFGQLAQAGLLWSNMGFSAVTWVIGFVLGAVAGIVTGLVVGSTHIAYKLVMPLMWAAWATPLVAIQPIIGVWFGFGMTPNIVLVFLSTAIPISLNTVAGVSGVNPSLLRAASVYGASGLQAYLKVRLPWTFPYIVGGIRLAIPTSLIGLLIGEMVSSPMGMGSLIVTSLARFRTNQAFSAILFFIIVSVVLVSVADLLERKAGAWREVSAR